MKHWRWWLIAILGLAFFLRWWHLEDWFYFTMDEELIAWRAWGLFELKRPFLIGGISPLQVHLPPYFYYLASLFLWPFQFNPLGWGYWAAGLALVTITLLFRLNRLAAWLYAVSLTAVFFDRHFWPLTLNPLWFLLTYLFLKRRHYWGLVMTLVMAVTSDPSNLALALALAAYLFLTKQFKRRLWPAFVSGLVIFFAPLLVFDLRHNWQNFLGLQKLFQTAKALAFSWPNFSDALLLIPRFLVRFWYSPQNNLLELHGYCFPFSQARQQALPIILVLLAVAVLIWFAKRHKFFGFVLTAYFLGISIFSILGYSVFDHYLAGLLPLMALITAKGLKKLPRFLAVSAILVFTLVNLTQILTAQNPYGLKYKQELVVWANQRLSGQEFALDSISKCHRENGLRYLFELAGNPPAISFMDSNFFWLYRQPPANTMPDKVLLVTDRPVEINQPVLDRAVFGAMTAYILDNSSQSYLLN